MRTQAWSVALLLAAALLAGGCGSKAQSETPGAARPGTGEIVFVVNRNGWNEIWVMDASGGHRRRLTDSPPRGTDAVGSTSPAWSPDGNRIAFVSSGDAPAEDENAVELYVMDGGGGGVRRLTENDMLDADPAWSPDGDRIAFVQAEGWGTEQVQQRRDLHLRSGRKQPPATHREQSGRHFTRLVAGRQGDHLFLGPLEPGEPRRRALRGPRGRWRAAANHAEQGLGPAPDWRRAPAASRSDKQMAREPVFDAWRGFRTRSGGIHCGFVCFRATDGFFARMVGKDLSTDDPLRIVTGTDPSLPGYESAEVTEIAPGDDWSSSDAQMVRCSVREAAIMCRHASGHGFFLDQDGHKTF